MNHIKIRQYSQKHGLKAVKKNILKYERSKLQGHLFLAANETLVFGYSQNIIKHIDINGVQLGQLVLDGQIYNMQLFSQQLFVVVTIQYLIEDYLFRIYQWDLTDHQYSLFNHDEVDGLNPIGVLCFPQSQFLCIVQSSENNSLKYSISFYLLSRMKVRKIYEQKYYANTQNIQILALNNHSKIGFFDPFNFCKGQLTFTTLKLNKKFQRQCKHYKIKDLMNPIIKQEQYLHSNIQTAYQLSTGQYYIQISTFNKNINATQPVPSQFIKLQRIVNIKISPDGKKWQSFMKGLNFQHNVQFLNSIHSFNDMYCYHDKYFNKLMTLPVFYMDSKNKIVGFQPPRPEQNLFRSWQKSNKTRMLTLRKLRQNDQYSDYELQIVKIPSSR